MPNNVKVLLVDDNPMVLGMLRGALTPLAIVTTAVADFVESAWLVARISTVATAGRSGGAE